MSTLSARDFFLPAAVLGNIVLGAYNLNAETKTDEEKTLRWVLAVFQFIIIALALLMTIPKYAKHVFGLIILLSIGAGVSAWFRFKGHEKTRIAFVTAQGLANCLFLLHFVYVWRHEVKQDSLVAESVKVKTNEDNIGFANKEIKKLEKQLIVLRGKAQTDAVKEVTRQQQRLLDTYKRNLDTYLDNQTAWTDSSFDEITRDLKVQKPQNAYMVPPD
jgi:hypothetical protein